MPLAMLFRHRSALYTETTTLRRVRFDGREHLVVPVVPIVAGVLNGYLIPPDELALFVEAWNGIPLPIGHPTEHGVPVSANAPEQLNEAVGRFFNARLEGDRLVGELWLDVAKCQALGGEALEVLRRVEAGAPLEVSTAFYAETDPTPGVYHGRPYEGIHRHLRPDHLALLPHDIGACSWADGCGAPRTHARPVACCSASREEPRMEEDQGLGAALKAFIVNTVQGLRGLPEPPAPVIHVLSEARRPRYSGTETTAWQAPSFEDYIRALFEGEDPPRSVGAASMGLKRRIAAHTLLGDPEAETFRDLSFFPVVNPQTGRLNEQALRAVIGGRGSQARIPEEARASAQRMARQLLNREFDAGLEVEALQTHLTDADIREAVHAALAREQNAPMTFLMVEAIEGDRVIYRDGERLKSRPFTITESGGIRLGDDIQEVTRDTRFHPVEEPQTQAAAPGLDQPSGQESPPMPHAAEDTITALINMPGSGWTAADRPLLEAMSPDALVKIHTLVQAQTASSTEPMPSPPAAPPTLEESLAGLPEEYREFVTHAVQEQKAKRQALIDGLAQDQACPFSAADLSAMPTPQLEKLQAMALAAKPKADYRAHGLPASPKRDADDQPPPPPDTLGRVIELQRARGVLR